MDSYSFCGFPAGTDAQINSTQYIPQGQAAEVHLVQNCEGNTAAYTRDGNEVPLYFYPNPASYTPSIHHA